MYRYIRQTGFNRDKKMENFKKNKNLTIEKCLNTLKSKVGSLLLSSNIFIIV